MKLDFFAFEGIDAFDLFVRSEKKTSDFFVDYGQNVEICSICGVSFLDENGNCQLCTKELCSPIEF